MTIVAARSEALENSWYPYQQHSAMSDGGQYYGLHEERAVKGTYLFSADATLLTIPAVDPMHQECINRVEDFSTLAFGWDGYEAKKINKGVINDCKIALGLLGAVPKYIWPTRKGTIRIEYKSGLRHQYIELLGGGEISSFSRDSKSKEISATAKNRLHDIRSIVERFLEHDSI